MSIYPGEKPFYGITTERDIAKLNLYPELLDLIYKLLPYIETLEDDEGYKKGTISKLTKEITGMIQKAEEVAK